MFLYLLSQSENNGYDTFDSAVVAAPDEYSAILIHPHGNLAWKASETWASSPERVKIEYLGHAKEGTKLGIICASFNAG